MHCSSLLDLTYEIERFWFGPTFLWFQMFLEIKCPRVSLELGIFSCCLDGFYMLPAFVLALFPMSKICKFDP